MKSKINLFTICILFSITSFGQITSKSKHIVINEPAGLNKIIMFSEINANTELNYNGNASAIKWFKFLNGNKTEVSNQSYIYPENNTGYILDTDGTETVIWVYDFSQYMPTMSSITPLDGEFYCSNVELQLDAEVPEFIYQTPQGSQLSIKREFEVNYETLTWQESNWVTMDTTMIVTLPKKRIIVPTPLTDTQFRITGDQYAKELNESLFNYSSNIYKTKAVKCNITTITGTREALNENNRPSDANQLDASAPLNVQFFSNPTPNVTDYEWKIFKNGELLITRREQDHEYTFEQSGNYKVHLKVSNQYCMDSASLDIIVSESKIYAPAIFTPNGDGFNDEFRVAYQSIVEFQGIIKNRWGRTLFSWSDPAKGWDGTVNGKPVGEGTYFYIIKARGSDDIPYTLKGHINLLR